MSNTPCSDPIIEAVVARLRRRSEVGKAKYQVTLAESPESTAAFLRHAQAEAMDLANYLEVLAGRMSQFEAAFEAVLRGEAVIVPVDPTNEMCAEGDYQIGHSCDAASTWNAMLAASPYAKKEPK